VGTRLLATDENAPRPEPRRGGGPPTTW